MILDYLKHSRDGYIQIPPFHTGHLGFIPDTEVSVGLMSFYRAAESHCELYVTPFTPNLEALCRLNCTMKDQPGAVNKLIEAVAALQINIVKKESSGINYLNHHFIEMVLDWSTSYLKQRETTPPDILSHYAPLQHRIPLMDYRYVLLYESIMCRCGDLVLFDDDYVTPLPAINIVPFTGKGPSETQRVEIEHVKDAGFKVRFQIPAGLHRKILSLTQHGNSEPLPYILSSETSSRSLRVFFPKKGIVPRILHVAFVHMDMPGALSAITKVLADAGFNILTGLLRKKTEDTSGYELVLEYKGLDDPPPAPTDGDYKPILEWVKTKIDACRDDDIFELSRFEVTISIPEYPKRPPVTPLEITPRENARMSGRASDSSNSLEVERRLLRECIERASENPKPRPHLDDVRIQYLMDVERRMVQPKPTIFFSYPHNATEHARRLKKRLEDELPNEFGMTDYQITDFENVVESVMVRIRECDYFIGIWHHEEKIGQRMATISPWMPFEYGIALEAKKQCIVIHSDKLPEEIWRRIQPGISQGGYNDLVFVEEMIPLVVEYCKTHWVHANKHTAGRFLDPGTT